MDVFAGAAHDVLARVATGLSPVVAKPGQVVAREGDVDDQFFLIESGTLTVTTEIAGSHASSLASVRASSSARWRCWVGVAARRPCTR